MRNLASSLFLTERDPDYYEGLYQPDGKTAVKPPRHRGRIVTTLQKAKEVRPLVEKCITIAKKSLAHVDAAQQYATSAERNTDEWRQWRESDQWQKWAQAMAPAVHARRRVFAMLRDKEAVELLFEEIAPRYVDRPGGYTRILRLAKPRLGDAGTQAILELVGRHDRVKQTSEKPSFESGDLESDESDSSLAMSNSDDAGSVEEEASADTSDAGATGAETSAESGESAGDADEAQTERQDGE